MLQHAAKLLTPNGTMLIVNQDENEYKIQEELLKKVKLNYTKKGCFKNSFIDYEHSRYITLVYSFSDKEKES
jgi:hypothetical protein